MLPPSAREILGFDDDAAVGSRRIEVGGGGSPLPGYLHVEIDVVARHVEVIAPAWQLPFPDQWARELMAIHVLEHLPPPLLSATLGEWHRILQPGGMLEVHVPNGPELMKAYLGGDGVAKWRAGAALLGMGASPNTAGPRDLTGRSDHQSIFDGSLIESLLMDAGFVDVTDLTDEVIDIHTAAWRSLVPHCSIVYRAARS